MAKVSICLPVYNGARHLAESIESALSQTYADFELLIADDSSTDESPSIIAGYAKRDARIIHWRNEHNLGLFANYNYCTSRASGEYIKPFAQDDVFHKEIIQSLVTVLDSDPSVSLVTCARCPIDTKGSRIEPFSEIERRIIKPFSKDTKLDGEQVISQSLLEGLNWVGEPSAQMYRNKALDEGFDTSFIQIGDLEHSFRLLQKGNYYFAADELVSFRKHAASSTAGNEFDLAAHLDWLLLGAKYETYLDDAGIKPFEYCLKFMKFTTHNLESNLNRSARLGSSERIEVLKDLFENANPFAEIMRKEDGDRNSAAEYKLLSAIAVMQSILSEHELRIVHDEIAKPYFETEYDNRRVPFVRAGILSALDAMKRTMRERDKEIHSLRQELNAMGNSVSWKLTEPLRRFIQLLPRKPLRCLKAKN